jgi:cyclopropane-fatty-acyl-phospholipid synthase
VLRKSFNIRAVATVTKLFQVGETSVSLLSFATDFANFGLLYSIANHRIHASSPLDQEENWKFWTDPKSPILVWLARSYPPEPARISYLDKMMHSDHASGIEAHYDVSNDFYALFLDHQYRFYTCAEFKNDTETLEEAQTNKANHLLALLDLHQTEKLLDLGCGWGAMLRFLQDAGHLGELTGLTLSKEQQVYAHQELGLNVSLTDFITDEFTGAPYDRILSIGSLEHVRPQELDQLYKKIYQALVPGGLAVHQFISLAQETYPTSMVLMQLFFPGSLIVLHHTHQEAAERAGFKITYDSIHDYKPTLRQWYERLSTNKAQALELVGLEIYNRYMTFFPVCWLFFQQHEADIHRIVMVRPA